MLVRSLICLFVVISLSSTGCQNDEGLAPDEPRRGALADEPATDLDSPAPAAQVIRPAQASLDVQTTDRLFVGRERNQFLRVAGGEQRRTREFVTLGRGAVGRVVVSDPGTLWTVGRYVEIGETGRGEFTLRNRAHLQIESWMRLATDANSRGRVLVTGAETTMHTGRLEVGRAGDGSLTVDNGAQVVGRDWMRLANKPGSHATVVIRDNNTRCSFENWISVGCEGHASLEVSNGAQLSIKGWARLAEEPGGSATVTIRGSGSLWQIGDACKVAEASNSDASIMVTDGGQILSSHGMFLGRHAALQITNGSLVRLARQLGVRSGRVRVFHESELAASEVHIGVNGYVTGDGIIRADVISKGKLAPEGPGGALQIEGSLTTLDSARLIVEVGSDRPLESLRITGPAKLAGTLEIRLTASHSDAFSSSILTAGSVESRFDEVVMAEPLRDRGATLTYTENSVSLSFDAAE